MRIGGSKWLVCKYLKLGSLTVDRDDPVGEEFVCNSWFGGSVLGQICLNFFDYFIYML